jgi:hypothetical protein
MRKFWRGAALCVALAGCAGTQLKYNALDIASTATAIAANSTPSVRNKAVHGRRFPIALTLLEGRRSLEK